jgi:hypothetical protein
LNKRVDIIIVDTRGLCDADRQSVVLLIESLDEGTRARVVLQP